MKIGKYPVKRSYKVSRLVADILSIGFSVLIVSLTFSFINEYQMILDNIGEDAVKALISHDPTIQWRQWVSMIFPALVLVIFAAYIIFSLKSHRLSKYDVNKRNAQSCHDTLVFGASIMKLPLLVIVFDYMCIVQDHLYLAQRYNFSWFSILSVLCVAIALIIASYTRHRLQKITAKADKAAPVDTGRVKVKAVAKSAEDKKTGENQNESTEKYDTTESKTTEEETQ